MRDQKGTGGIGRQHRKGQRKGHRDGDYSHKKDMGGAYRGHGESS